MNPEHAAAAIRFILGILALVLIWQRVYLPISAEYLRQDIFKIRRELFLSMVDGHIERDDPVYVHLMFVMNGLLRTAEKMTMTRLAVFSRHSPTKPSESRWALLTEGLDPDEKRMADYFYNQTFIPVIWHVARTSPIVWAMAGVVVALRPFRRAKKRESVATSFVRRSYPALEEELCASH